MMAGFPNENAGNGEIPLVFRPMVPENRKLFPPDIALSHQPLPGRMKMVQKIATLQ